MTKTQKQNIEVRKELLSFIKRSIEEKLNYTDFTDAILVNWLIP